MNTQISTIAPEIQLDKKVAILRSELADKIHKKFKEECDAVWKGYRKMIFGNKPLENMHWSKVHEIYNILKVFSCIDNSNYVLFPECGGDEIDDVKIVGNDRLRLYGDGNFNEFKPLSLHFEYIDDEFEWSYFRLETIIMSKNRQRGKFIILKKSSQINNRILDNGNHNNISPMEIKKQVILERQISNKLRKPKEILS